MTVPAREEPVSIPSEEASAKPYTDSIGKFKKGNPGKPKGAIARINRPFSTLKQAFLDAFNDSRVGGVEGLVQWIIKDNNNKRHFYQWITKMLPRTVDIQGVDPISPSNLNNLKDEELDAVLIGLSQALAAKKVTNG
ncbi:MAG: hypothetical protein EOM12_03680 [Verrucomicrobiae bacterium]|nr:hypothetical protein [Verrucomicrobiae bacterium]